MGGCRASCHVESGLSRWFWLGLNICPIHETSEINKFKALRGELRLVKGQNKEVLAFEE
jgi:hypothetical protein